MPWISLSAHRHELRAILELNRDYVEDEAARLDDLDAMFGRAAVLVGDERHAGRETKLAARLLEEFREYIDPPNPVLLGHALSLAVIAELGGADCGHVFESIAGAKGYKEKDEKSLQLLARRITGAEKTPTKPYGERGHVETEAEWLRVVKSVSPADAFDLSVTPDHPRSSLLERFILPLGYLAARAESAPGWRERLREMLRRGTARPDGLGRVVYERAAKRPPVEVELNPEDRATWRGFDAVELRGDGAARAYYYLGVRWQAPLFFEEMINVYKFLDGVELDWRLVEESVGPDQWREVNEAKERGKCSYVVVYDETNANAPEPALKRAREHYGLDIVPLDLTEV